MKRFLIILGEHDLSLFKLSLQQEAWGSNCPFPALSPPTVSLNYFLLLWSDAMSKATYWRKTFFGVHSSER